MPELPEVEATRRHLSPELTGRSITTVDVRRERMVRRQHNPADVPARLEGRRVLVLGRLGKFILGRLTDDFVWVMHLGMSGRMQLAKREEAEAAHTNVVVTFDSGIELRFVDPRTFGFMAVFTSEEYAASSLARLGRDALTDLPRTPELARLLAGRTAPIKALLLDQGVIAGLGNIYADEVLHRAGIDPRRSGGSLLSDEVGVLRRAIRPVLESALAAGGTSLDDLAYLLPDGRAGDHLDRLAVYGRTGSTCRRCGGEIRSEVIRARTTHWCPGCQR